MPLAAVEPGFAYPSLAAAVEPGFAYPSLAAAVEPGFAYPSLAAAVEPGFAYPSLVVVPVDSVPTDYRPVVLVGPRLPVLLVAPGVASPEFRQAQHRHPSWIFHRHVGPGVL
jgi:hypothetical protein